MNTASRMQSTGEESRIHMTEDTFQLLKNHYKCEEKRLEVKGKGVLK